jgi:hypothetical protein
LKPRGLRRNGKRKRNRNGPCSACDSYGIPTRLPADQEQKTRIFSSRFLYGLRPRPSGRLRPDPGLNAGVSVRGGSLAGDAHPGQAQEAKP